MTGTWQGYVDANYYVINTTYNINEYRSGDMGWSTLQTHTISSDVVSDLRRSYSWLTYECDINIAFVRVTSGLQARTASARIRVSRPHDGGTTMGGIASTSTVMGNVQGVLNGRGTSSDSGSATVRTGSDTLNSLSLIIQYDASSSFIVCRVWSTYIRAYFHN